MARRLDSFPIATRVQQYPWDEWLDGNVWQLDRGTDYRAKASAVIANGRSQAKRRGGSLRTRLLEEGSTSEAVIVQFRREG